MCVCVYIYTYIYPKVYNIYREFQLYYLIKGLFRIHQIQYHENAINL